jgi:hypothetical protein
MNARLWCALIVVGVLGSAAASTVLSYQPAKADANLEKANIGRYAVAAVPMDHGGPRIVVCDTATGECWWLGNGGKWVSEGSPTSKEGETAKQFRKLKEENAAKK